MTLNVVRFRYDPDDGGELGVYLKVDGAEEALEVLRLIRGLSLALPPIAEVNQMAGPAPSPKVDGVPEVVYPVDHGLVEAAEQKYRVTQVSPGSFKLVPQDSFMANTSFVGKSKEEAVIQGLLSEQEAVAAEMKKADAALKDAKAAEQKPPSVEASKPEKKVEQEAEKDVPAALVSATTLRQVMTWMLAKDGGGYAITDIDGIAARCDALKPHVPVLARMAGHTRDRVERALSIVAQNAAAT